MNVKRLMSAVTLSVLAAGVGIGLLSANAAAQVTATLVSGTTCAGGSSTGNFTPNGPDQTVTLCVSATGSNLCGGTYILASANAGEDGRFAVTSRTLLGTVMTDPSTAAPAFPVSIVSTGTVDFGGTSGTATSQAGAADQAVATFTIKPQATATNSSYVLSLLNSGMTTTTSDCVTPADFVDNPITATFTFVQPSTATIAVAPGSVADNGTPLTYTVTLAPAPGITTLVNVTSNVTGTMTGVTNTCTGTVSVSAGGTGTCTISATNTVGFDGPATATVTVVAGSGYVVGAPAQAAGTITNDDIPTVNVSAVPTTLVDAAGNVSTVTVSIGGNAPAGGFIVPLTTTVQDPTRATTTCGTQITVPAGASSATCTVTATANTVSGDGNKTVTVAPNCSGTCANGTTATVNINDDDVPTVTVAASPTTLTDSASQVSTFTFTTSTASTSDITVNITPPAASPRYTTTCGATVTILANQTTATCTVTATANTDAGDGSATATVTVNTCTTSTTCNVGNPATATVTINDDDKPTITIAAVPTSISENGGVSTVTITATAPAGGTLANGQSVSVVLSGTGTGNTLRYTSTCTSPQTVNFTGAATATATCTITAVDNATVDGDVSATVTVGASASYTVGNPSAATVTITDDEHGITVTPSVSSVDEGQSAVFNLSCGGSVGTVVVNYTVTGADSGTFSSSITLNCPTGGQVTVPTVDDSTTGNGRSVTLTIDSLGQGAPVGTVVGTPATATVLVNDNDRPTVIPTLSDLGLLTLLLTMAGVAGFALRRKI